MKRVWETACSINWAYVSTHSASVALTAARFKPVRRQEETKQRTWSHQQTLGEVKVFNVHIQSKLL